MKNIQLYIILALLIVIALMLLFSRGNRQMVYNIQAKYDSVLKPHITRIATLKRHEDILKHDITAVKEKAKSDSLAYKKTISKLKKELSMAKFTGVPTQVPNDTVQLAMDCLEKEPYRDSISWAQEARIEQLEIEKNKLVQKYEALLADNQAEKHELAAMIDVKNEEIKELKKLVKKAGRKGFLKGLGVGIPAGGAGGVFISR